MNKDHNSIPCPHPTERQGGSRSARVVFGLIATMCLGLCSLTVYGAQTELGYGGRLTLSDGSPVVGPVTLTVRFYSEAQGGTAIGPTLTFANTPLAEGVFQITLALTDLQIAQVFGDGGSKVFIEVEAQSKVYPRQQLLAVPYALRIPVDGDSLVFSTDGTLQVGSIGQSQVAGLATALAGKADTSQLAAKADTASVTAQLATKADSSALAGKADANTMLSGDVSGALNGTITVQKLQGVSLPTPDASQDSNKYLQYNGSSFVLATISGSSGGTVTNVTASPPLAVSNSSTTPALSIGAASGGSDGYLSASDFIAFTNKQAAITQTSTVDAGTLTSAQQIGVELKPSGSGTGELRFDELDGTGRNYVGFKSADSLATSTIWTLPLSDGTSGQVLKTDGAGQLAWTSGLTPSGAASGDLSGSYPGPTVAQVGGVSAAAVASGAGAANSATSDNTAARIVMRDGSGNFAAGTITADLTGNVTGDVTGNLIGDVTGNVIGDVTGNVSGTAGNVTGIVAIANGGTNATTAADARTSLGAAASGVNSDITALTGLTTPLSIGQGGTGATTAQPLFVFAGPELGPTPGAPSFRALVAADIPELSAAQITSGTLNNARINWAAPSAIGSANPNTGAFTSVTTAAEVGLELKPTVSATGELRFDELDGTGANYVGFKSADSLATSTIWTLPLSDGTSGQVLKTDGAGQLAWTSDLSPSGAASGDLSGSYPGPTVSQVGGVSAVAVASGASAANSATSDNTPSQIIMRDSSGNFSAGTITADLTGNVTGDVTGNVTGDVTGNVTGDVTGNVIGDVTGNVSGTSNNVTGVVAIAHGGTNATTAADARTSLGAAASGANSDITALTGLTTPLTVAQGGIGVTSASPLQVFAGPSIGPTAGAPSFRALEAVDIPDLSASKITSGILPVGRGGTGLSTSPTTGQLLIGNGTGYTLGSIVAGTNISVGNGTGAITISAAADTSKVAKAGDTMTGALNLPADGLVAGTNQLVLANGNVGIGTTSPQTALTINQNSDKSLYVGNSSAASGGGRIEVGYDSTDFGRVQVYSTGANSAKPLALQPWAGKVGIGTTVPIKPLTVSSFDTNDTSIALLNTTGPAGGFLLGVRGSSGGWAPEGGFGIMDGSAGATRFVIDANGNIGIATTSPGSVLQVNGGAAIGYSASTTAPSNGLAVSGNVGIGTTSPGAKLAVNGLVESTTGGYKFPDGTTQTTAASGGGITTCPAGFTMIGTSGRRGTYCIHTTAQTAKAWLAAKQACTDLNLTEGAAFMCDHNEWYKACLASSATLGMGGALEWVAEFSGNTDAFVAGSGSCGALSSNNMTTANVFRCCVR